MYQYMAHIEVCMVHIQSIQLHTDQIVDKLVHMD
jgi:hypothetical protein